MKPVSFILTVDYFYEAYLAVPYANATRYEMATYPYPSWSGIRDATDYGTQCYQNPSSSELARPLPVSEQCLHLYIYVPEGVSCSR